MDYPAVTVSATSPVTVIIKDPCKAPLLSVTASTLVNQSYYIASGPLGYTIDPFTVSSSWCPLTYTTVTSDVTADAAISFNAATQTYAFNYSSDLNLVALSPFTVTVTGTSDTVSQSTTFTLTFLDPCGDPARSSIVTPPSPMTTIIYPIAEGAKAYSL